MGTIDEFFRNPLKIVLVVIISLALFVFVSGIISVWFPKASEVMKNAGLLIMVLLIGILVYIAFTLMYPGFNLEKKYIFILIIVVALDLALLLPMSPLYIKQLVPQLFSTVLP